MNINQAHKILNKLGKSTTLEDSCMKENVAPYENFYILKRDEDKWVYGLFMVERQNTPYLEITKEFDTEVEAAKHFFLDRLSSFYFLEKFLLFVMEYEGLGIGGPTFNQSKLFKAMSILGIPASLFALGQSQVRNRAIMLEMEDEASSVVSFVNDKGNVIQSTVAIRNRRALFIAFKKVYLLYQFENEVKNLLEAEGIANNFSEGDINTFLS
ncbi:hypothetical protein [Bacillus haynesii]|uniref:hypothetical protein n=1 Tax=Bacillus haynesii TaxID=1925021 RepID=UPI001F60F431|nr:hypothetical protein [Bacillus haynesii]MCI4129871.1 hypothetical protein [Bacillus haynesii]